MFKKGDIVSILSDAETIKNYRFVCQDEIGGVVLVYYLDDQIVVPCWNNASWYELVTSILREE